MSATIQNRLETAFLFLGVGPLIGALPFIILFFFEDVLKKGEGASVLLIPLLYSYFFAAIPALLTGIFHQWFVYRRPFSNALRGHLVFGFFVGFLSTCVFFGGFFRKGNDRDWEGYIQLALLGAVSGAICAFLDWWRRRRGWYFGEDILSSR